jgi:hypothetical protein
MYSKVRCFLLSSNVRVKSPESYKSIFMLALDNTESEFSWSTIGPLGSTLSTVLPRKISNFRDFTKADIATGDNDPVYWAVVKAKQEWGYDWATKFCVGMLTYYHVGTAAAAADYNGPEFWAYIRDQYGVAPRGSGRRHFRGAAGLNALQIMEQFSPNPNDFFYKFARTYLGVKSGCETRLAQFGPYFQLKVADYMDRCLELSIHSYDGLARNLSTIPKRAALAEYPHLPSYLAFQRVCDSVKDLQLLAPPIFDRPIGPAEIESCLCDWYHIKSGSNWIGSDNQTKRASFKGYGWRAEAMAEFMPPVIPKNLFVYAIDADGGSSV